MLRDRIGLKLDNNFPHPSLFFSFAFHLSLPTSLLENIPSWIRGDTASCRATTRSDYYARRTAAEG